jgi:hypothetical protein
MIDPVAADRDRGAFDVDDESAHVESDDSRAMDGESGGTKAIAGWWAEALSPYRVPCCR